MQGHGSSWRLGSLCLLAFALAVLGTHARAAGPAPFAKEDVALRARFGDAVVVRWDAARRTPKSLRGMGIATTGPTAAERAVRFVRSERALLGLDGDVEVIETRSLPRSPRTTVRLRQLIQGLPVEGRAIAVTLDAEQRVVSVESDLGPLRVPVPVHRIDARRATDIVRETFIVVGVGTPTAVVVANGPLGRVAWKVPAARLPMSGLFWIWVDAESGAVLKVAPAALDQSATELPLRNPEEDAQ